jgi:uncharacterized protein
VAIRERQSGDLLAERAGWYDSLWDRFRGLMLKRRLPAGEGIVLMPCNSVHMALMRMALDVVYFDADQRVVKLVGGLKPYRVSFGGRRARAAIELPAGTLIGKALAVGDRLDFEPVSA